MEQTEKELGMHISELETVFLKNPGRFLTFKAIAEFMKKAEWSKFDCIRPALEAMIQRGQLEHDEVYGYCKRGLKNALRQELAKPSLPRSEFDRQTYAEQAEFCASGGRVVNG